MKILEVIYRFFTSNTLFRFSSKPSYVNIYSVVLWSPGRWYALNSLELCHQSDLHLPPVPTEERMASVEVSEGRDGATHGADRTKDTGQAGPDGYLDKPAYPRVILCTVYKVYKVLHKSNRSVILNDATFLQTYLYTTHVRISCS